MQKWGLCELDLPLLAENKCHQIKILQGSLRLIFIVNIITAPDKLPPSTVIFLFFPSALSVIDTYNAHCPRMSLVVVLDEVDVSDLLVKAEDVTNVTKACTYHTFPDPAAVVQLRSQLLQWYDKDKRELPWRTLVWRRPFFTR